MADYAPLPQGFKLDPIPLPPSGFVPDIEEGEMKRLHEALKPPPMGYVPDGEEVSTVGGTPREKLTAKKIKEVSRQVARSTADIAVGTAETGLSMATGIVGETAAGLEGIGAALESATGGKKFQEKMGKPVEAATKKIQEVREKIVHEPKTDVAQGLLQGAAEPFVVLDKVSEAAGNAVLERTGSPAMATAVHTAIAGLPAYAPYGFTKVWRGVKRTGAYRRLTIKERAVVKQTLKETLEKQGFTEGQKIRILKKQGEVKAFEEALAKRSAKEAPKPKEPLKPKPAPPPEYSAGDVISKEISGEVPVTFDGADSMAGAPIYKFQFQTPKGLADFTTRTLSQAEIKQNYEVMAKKWNVPTKEQLDTTKVKVKGIRKKTGDEILVEETATEALRDVKVRRDLFTQLMDCLSG